VKDERDARLREAEQVLFEVLDALEGASVEARERRIVWRDGARLSIEETVRRIHAESGEPIDLIQSHVVGWLEMMYVPERLDEQQMEEFEQLIEEWIAPYDDVH
jgi:hypothetical protein